MQSGNFFRVGCSVHVCVTSLEVRCQNLRQLLNLLFSSLGEVFLKSVRTQIHAQGVGKQGMVFKLLESRCNVFESCACVSIRGQIGVNKGQVPNFSKLSSKKKSLILGKFHNFCLIPAKMR